MKITDFLLVPLVAFLILLFSSTISFSLFSVVLILTAAASYELYVIHRRLTQNFKQQERSFISKLEGTAKDMHLVESQLETVFNNIPSPLALLDTYGQLVLVNHSFDRFLKAVPSKLLDYRDELIDPAIRLFLKESYLTEKAIVRNVDFNGIDFQCLSVPIQENSRYAGCLLIFQDITQAVEKERMQKRFIADASHELKTPIAAIKGMIEILNRRDFDDEEVMRDFHLQIEKETHRLERIVSDLLQLSRLSAGQILLQKEAVNVTELIENVIHEIPISEKKGIEIQVHSTIQSLVWLDRDRIHQVIGNLLKNACLHSGATEVMITVFELEKEIEIQIHDNGCGISATDLEHIFERFYRVDTHRARSSGGSGLGLAIVKSIVNAHHGEVKVLSEVGKGTQFNLTLPKEQ